MPLRPTDIGRRAVLAFVAGELDRPIVLGLLAEADGLQDATESAAEVSDEPDELVLTANTKTLQAFILRHAKDKDFFAEPTTLQRQ